MWEMDARMDFRKFGLFVLFVGVVVLAIGGAKWQANQPQPGDFRNGDGIAPGWQKSYQQSIAAKIMMGGGVAALIGLAVAISAKKPD